MGKHTELPWREEWDEDSCAGLLLILDESDRLVAKTYDEQAATEIQFYANNHARLVEALRECIAALAFDDKGDRLLTAMNCAEKLTELGETE